MTWRNPWRISWLTGELTEDGDDERYSVDDQLAYLERIWREAVEDADHGSELDRALLRVRAGARHACARLRLALEYERQQVARMTEESDELKCKVCALEDEIRYLSEPDE